MYTLAITGPIGAGKSSLIKNLKKKLNCSIIPEYIDGDPIFGLEMLKRFIDGKISSLTFQSYILDYYANIICNENNYENIVLLEKLPYDSVYCFGYVAFKNGNLTKQEFDVLVEKLQKINANFPNYKESLIVIESDTSENVLNKTLKIINEDIKNNIKHRVIYLRCNLETCKERIAIRNRSGEDNYPDNYLQQIIDFYEQFV